MYNERNMILEPYQLWFVNIENKSKYETAKYKYRPIIILETYYDKSDLNDPDFDLSDIYPDFVNGTSQVDKYKYEDNAVLIERDSVPGKLSKDTVFRFSQVLSQDELSVNDILLTGTYKGFLPYEIQNEIYSKITGLGIRLPRPKYYKKPVKKVGTLHESIDSENNELSKEQIEFFKNSKIRDKDGNLLVCYHGTPNPGFTEFNPKDNKSQFGKYKFRNSNVNYFTTEFETAKGYTELGIGDVDKEFKNIYACYLNITNPYIVNNETKDDFENYITRTWKNVRDKKVRQKQLDTFNKFIDKWEYYIFDNENDVDELNDDLYNFGIELRPCEEDNTYYDVWKLASNTKYGQERIVMKEYTLDELFDDYLDEFKETIIGSLEDEDINDYSYTLDDIVKWVLLMNKEDGTDYDGIILEDILDIGPKGSPFSAKGIDIVTLKSSNQIKLISNKTPTLSNNINEDINSLGNSLTKEQEKFFKNSRVRDDNGNLLVMYHGSISKFDTFKSNINWFSEDKVYADSYSNWSDKKPEEYKVYLNCENILDCGNTDTRVFSMMPIKPYKLSEDAKTLCRKLEISESKFNDIIDSISTGLTSQEIYKMKLFSITRTYQFADLVKSKGYDSISTIEQGHYCIGVFEPNRIKSITNTNPTDSININEKLGKRIVKSKQSKNSAKLNDNISIIDAFYLLKDID